MCCTRPTQPVLEGRLNKEEGGLGIYVLFVDLKVFPLSFPRALTVCRLDRDHHGAGLREEEGRRAAVGCLENKPSRYSPGASIAGQRVPIYDAFVACPTVHPGAQSLSGVRLLCDPMACSPPGLSVHGFSRQEYWTGLPFPSPGDLPAPGNQPLSPESPAMTADSSPLSHQGSPAPTLEALKCPAKG